MGLVLSWDHGTRIYLRLDPKWKGRVSKIRPFIQNNIGTFCLLYINFFLFQKCITLFFYVARVNPITCLAFIGFQKKKTITKFVGSRFMRQFQRQRSG